MRKALKWGGVNLLVCAVLLEGISVVGFALNPGGFFYTRKASEPVKLRGLPIDETRLNLTVVERLHPYFGFVQHPGPDWRPGFSSNNFGFISPYTYPFRKTGEDVFLIGVFGGSVASNYSIYEVQQGILASHLRTLPGFEEKEIHLMSFAAGGYKQPQQLLILNYLMAAEQELDLVINIDGFNEVALSRINLEAGFHPLMPSSSHVGPLAYLANGGLSPEAMEALVNLRQIKSRLNEGVLQLRTCRLASTYTLTQLRVQSLKQREQEAITRFEQAHQISPEGDRLYHIYPPDASGTAEGSMDDIADTWATTSRLMHDLLSANGIPYVHILQPNQYHSTGRTFSEAERRQAIREETPYRAGVEAGYPLLLERLPTLRSEGVQVFSAVTLFDDVEEAVYIDTCCHYTPEGEHRLSEFVADRVVHVLGHHQLNPPVATETGTR